MARIVRDRVRTEACPQSLRVGTDERSQRAGAREARRAAAYNVSLGRAADYELELIREKARRGVNMELGQ